MSVRRGAGSGRCRGTGGGRGEKGGNTGALQAAAGRRLAQAGRQAAGWLRLVAVRSGQPRLSYPLAPLAPSLPCLYPGLPLHLPPTCMSWATWVLSPWFSALSCPPRSVALPAQEAVQCGGRAAAEAIVSCVQLLGGTHHPFSSWQPALPASASALRQHNAPPSGAAHTIEAMQCKQQRRQTAGSAAHLL